MASRAIIVAGLRNEFQNQIEEYSTPRSRLDRLPAQIQNDGRSETTIYVPRHSDSVFTISLTASAGQNPVAGICIDSSQILDEHQSRICAKEKFEDLLSVRLWLYWLADLATGFAPQTARFWTFQLGVQLHCHAASYITKPCVLNTTRPITSLPSDASHIYVQKVKFDCLTNWRLSMRIEYSPWLPERRTIAHGMNTGTSFTSSIFLRRNLKRRYLMLLQSLHMVLKQRKPLVNFECR